MAQIVAAALVSHGPFVTGRPDVPKPISATGWWVHP